MVGIGERLVGDDLVSGVGMDVALFLDEIPCAIKSSIKFF